MARNFPTNPRTGLREFCKRLILLEYSKRGVDLIVKVSSLLFFKEESMGKEEGEKTKAEGAICDICGAAFKDKRGLAGHKAGRHGVRSATTGATIITEQELETPPAPEAKPTQTEETRERDEVELTTIRTAGIFTYEITLPADAFTLYNLAKACGLEKDEEKLFDEWVWDCIRARFSKDYKQQLVLAPVED